MAYRVDSRREHRVPLSPLTNLTETESHSVAMATFRGLGIFIKKHHKTSAFRPVISGVFLRFLQILLNIVTYKYEPLFP